MSAKSPLGQLIDEVVGDARRAVGSGLYDIGLLDNGKGKARELHVSLSRPTYLRAHQREDLKRAVKAIAKSHPPCVCHNFRRYYRVY